MSDIVLKYNSLNKIAKQEVNDFMDFLLSKQKNNSTIFLSAYKKKILNVSAWSDSDLKVIEDNQKLFNQWRVQRQQSGRDLQAIASKE